MPKARKFKSSLIDKVNLDPNSEMAQMLKLSNREFKIIVINMLGALMEKQTACKNRWLMKAEG